MVPPLSPRRIVEESLPVGAILLVWNLLAEVLYVVDGAFAQAARLAGLVMALLYVTVRGLRLGRSIPPRSPPDGVQETLLDSGYAALAAAFWVGVALVLKLLLAVVELVAAEGPGDPFEPLYFALAGTAVATVVLYAVANGSARVRSPLSGRSRSVRAD